MNKDAIWVKYNNLRRDHQRLFTILKSFTYRSNPDTSTILDDYASKKR